MSERKRINDSCISAFSLPWLKFLVSQPSNKVSLKNNITDYINSINIACFSTTFDNPNNIHNTVEFYNRQYPKAAEMRPYDIRQEYSRPPFNITMGMKDYLYSVFNVLFKTDVFNGISLSAIQNIGDKNCWQNYQMIFINLTPDYLNSLKKKKLIPDVAKVAGIWIKKYDNSPAIANIQSGATNIDFPIFSETLQTICQAAHLSFGFNSDGGQTNIILGPTHFSLQNPDIKKLNHRQILQALKGSDPNKLFLFPIHVNGQAPTQLTTIPSLQ